jgi:hypothetical protein
MVLVGKLLPVAATQIVHELPQVEALRMQLELADLEARDVQEIVGQGDESVGGRNDVLHELALPYVRRRAGHGPAEEVRRPLDDRDRIAQLMSRDGEELITHPDRVLRLLIQPRVVDRHGGAVGQLLKSRGP